MKSIKQMLGASHEETEQREVEQQLRIFHALTEHAIDAIATTDMEANLIYGNQACYELFGYDYDRQEMRGLPLGELWAEEENTVSFDEVLRHTMAGWWKGEIRQKCRDGTMFDAYLTTYLIRDERERPLVMAVMLRNITELNRIEEELHKTGLQLQEASQHKSDFLANMGHELRTPLNAIIGFTSITINALRDTLPPEHLQNLTKVEQAARILMQLINDILDFSKIEAERMETYIEEFPLDDLVEELIVTAEGLLVDKELELNYEIEPDLPLVENDYIKVKQILSNLMSNAVKFTTEGGVTVRARISPNPSEGGEVVRVEVEDTGCGIPEEKLATIFESFKQVDGSIKKKFGGTGLGLAISKKFCESLGIEIGVWSEVGKGTTFWLNTPVKYQEIPLQEISSRYSAPGFQEPGEEIEEEFFPELSAKAVVVCLFSQATCETIKQYLEGLPLELQHAGTVAECVELGKTQLVWTILVEPNGDGFEMLVQLKSKPFLSRIPIIFCSLDAKENGFHQLGPIEHLTKPIDREQLLEILLRITKQQHGDILAVDDDPNIRDIYGQILSGAGYTPHVVENGLEALNFLRDHPFPQAMILDLLMPKMDGFQVLDRVQANEAWRRIPIVVVTGKTLTPEERKRIDEGAQQLLLHKDTFPVEELPKQIESVVHAVTLAGTQSILVVDDNQMNLDLMTGVFRTAGYTVYTANSGQAGIDTTKAVMPDAIVMDLAMPGMDGFEATRQIKQHPATANITVIACSAFATKDFQKRAFQAGCEGYITKPIEPERLVDQFTKLVLTSKIRRRILEYGKDISDR
ncbi:MAG: response regulator [bacterium]|nr:response regulator [bacterium]